MNAGSTIGWCRSTDIARELARMFVAHLTPEYISHGELQGPRAASPTTWSCDIASVIEDEFVQRVGNASVVEDDSQTQLLAYMETDGRLTGVFLIAFSGSARIPYATVEDMMVVEDARHMGHGKRFMDWLTDECSRRGIHRLFLESGVKNADAHEFFAKDGFETVSVVMMKTIQA